MEISLFESSLKKSKDINQINKILKDYLRNLKITTFSFTYYATHAKSKEKIQYDFSSENFSAWHEHYLQEGYSEVDATFLDVYQTTLPVFLGHTTTIGISQISAREADAPGFDKI